MTKAFMDLSLPFVMDLFRIKCGAESRGDATALASLEKQYPELFSDDFMEFIDTVKATAAYLSKKYGEDFSSMFEPKVSNIARILN